MASPMGRASSAIAVSSSLANARVRFFVITTDPVRLPPETTWHLMTNLPGKIEQTVGNTFELRTWIEYGFKQAEDELGWADYRLTDAASIEHWWEHEYLPPAAPEMSKEGWISFVIASGPLYDSGA